jgi:hypothetical protein
MTTFPGSPPLIRAGLVLVDPDSGAVQRVIALQYNPDTLTRTLQPQAIAGDAQDRSQALRLQGPPVETIKLDAELDATDGLEFPDQNPTVVQSGVGAQLAALETLAYPPSSRLIANDALQASGTLEILPLEQPLTLFVWGSQRIVPVRITDLSITEEAFDARLNPIRAKVSLSLRVLSVDDLGFGRKGGSLYLAYQQTKERLATRGPGGSLPALGLTGIP